MSDFRDLPDDVVVGMPALLADVLHTVAGRAASIYTPDVAPDQPGAIWASAGLPDEALRDYAAHYHRGDLWAQAASRTGPPPIGSVIDTDRLVDPAMIRASEFHNDYLDRFDIARCLVAIIDDGRGRLLPRIRLTVVRSRSEPAFTPQDVDRLAHFGRLARSFAALAVAHDSTLRAARLQSATVDMVRMPVILVERDRRVLLANRSAAALLHSGGPLLSRQGRLHVRSAAADREVGAGLAWIAERQGAVRFVRLAPGRRSPVLMITPLAGPGSDGVLVVRLVDPGSADRDGPMVLRDLLDLTPAECEVAIGLAEGLSHDEIARRRGVMVTSVRTTLRRLQEKLGIQRTGPLARYIHDVMTLGGLRL